MGFVAQRVKELNCGRCAKALDPSVSAALSTIVCPHCGAKVVIPAVFDSYLLLKRIGRGATGVVYKALDRVLRRQIAIKILKADGDADLRAKECIAEARSLAALNHPNIVQIYKIG